MEKKLKIGLIGLGTVGCGVVKVISQRNDIEIVLCAVKNLSKKREVELNCLTDDIYKVVNHPDIDVVVEVAGGIGVFDALKCAIKNKKHIVTANKELLARHGAELFDLAGEYGTTILYEAAVAGAIPVIGAIKTSLKANSFNCVAGILNGTTNYILTKMEEENLSYEECLKKAQELGYAETDPTGDVEGFDSMYKIAILSNIVFNKRIDVNKIYREGITKISADDIKIAGELGYKIKLIAYASKLEDNSLDIRVHPMLVSTKHALSSVKYSTNACMLSGFPVDDIMFTGKGAGQFPTTSSVVGDILSIKAEYIPNMPILPLMKCCHSEFANQTNIENTKNCYYLSILADNVPGVIGKIGNSCAKYGINISYIIQKGLISPQSAKVIVITENCLEKNMNLMINELEESGTKVINKIRVLSNV